MATVAVYSADKMQAIADNTIVGASIVNGHLILQTSIGGTVDAGSIQNTLAINDTAANLAASNPVLFGSQIGRATDTNVIKVGDGVTAWNSLPSLRFDVDPQIASSTLQQAGIVATSVDLTGLSVTFTVGGIPWEVEAYLPYITAVTASVIGNVFIADSGNVVKAQRPFSLATADSCGLSVKERIATPGTYTRKVRIARASGTGTITVLANLAVLTAFIKAGPQK